MQYLTNFKAWWKSYSIHSDVFLVNIFTVAWCVFFGCLSVVNFSNTLDFADALLAAFIVAICVENAEQIADVITKKRAVEVLGFELYPDFIDPCDKCPKVGRVWYRRTDYWCDEGEYLCAGCVAAEYRENKAEEAKLERLEVEIRNEVNVLVEHGHSLACAHDMAWVGAPCECMPALDHTEIDLVIDRHLSDAILYGMSSVIFRCDGVRQVDARAI